MKKHHPSSEGGAAAPLPKREIAAARRRVSFYASASRALDRARFEQSAAHLCVPAIRPRTRAPDGGRARSWTAAGTYGRLLLVAVVEGARSERALSLLAGRDRAIEAFVAGGGRSIPRHSTIARLRQLLGPETHLELLTVALEALAAARVALGRDRPDDATLANDLCVRRGSGTSYQRFLECLLARALVRSGYDVETSLSA